MMKVGPVVSLLVLAGCATGRFGAVQPAVARFESCYELREEWPKGVSARGGPLERRAYELNQHLAYEIGYACRPGESVVLAERGGGAPGLGIRGSGTQADGTEGGIQPHTPAAAEPARTAVPR
ncbi:MAG: hypothetical protein OXH04_15800 [Acidobacteria bacterium]|nr:hypothetical protein [Acidobacteriota bacterium]